MYFPLFPALVLAAVLNIDRHGFGQNMFSRPLVTGFLMGLALGQIQIGLSLGLWSELLWLSRPPLGGVIQPNGGLAVSTAILAWFFLSLLYPTTGTNPSLVVAFALVPPLAKIATIIDSRNRHHALKTTDQILGLLEKGQSPAFMHHNLRGLFKTLIETLIFLLLATPAVTIFIHVSLTLLPYPIMASLEKMQPYLPLMGLIILTISFPVKNFPWFISGLAAGLVIILCQ